MDKKTDPLPQAFFCPDGRPLLTLYKDGSEILIPQENGKNPRRLSPRECARLMGYPDDYRIDRVSDVQAYRQCGNSVIVPLITAVSEQIMKTLNA